MNKDFDIIMPKLFKLSKFLMSYSSIMYYMPTLKWWRITIFTLYFICWSYILYKSYNTVDDFPMLFNVLNFVEIYLEFNLLFILVLLTIYVLILLIYINIYIFIIKDQSNLVCKLTTYVYKPLIYFNNIFKVKIYGKHIVLIQDIIHILTPLFLSIYVFYYNDVNTLYKLIIIILILLKTIYIKYILKSVEKLYIEKIENIINYIFADYMEGNDIKYDSFHVSIHDVLYAFINKPKQGDILKSYQYDETRFSDKYKEEYAEYYDKPFKYLTDKEEKGLPDEYNRIIEILIPLSIYIHEKYNKSSSKLYMSNLFNIRFI